VRPVGIGESLRRLLGKAVMSATRGDVERVCGAVQLCSGLSGGCEAGAGALQKMWEDPNVQMVLLVDATNAFNVLARTKALMTTWERCPALAQTLQNLYGHDSDLALGDGTTIPSREGTTQGCPLGMAMFAVASLPLIEVTATDGTRQIWYADDSGGGAR
jgi:hypothetical protein